MVTVFMKILGVESSATAASAAVLCDGKITSLQFTNTGLTHSETLMPMIERALSSAGVELSDIDYVAVSYGPGSFTGVRIGVATVKGLCFAQNKKCVPVSSLEAAVMPLEASGCYAVAVMDARCKQFYTATFLFSGGKCTRLQNDRAISYEELRSDLLKLNEKNIILIGDGTDVCYNLLKDSVKNLYKAPSCIRWQSADSVALAAYEKLLLAGDGAAIPAESLVPFYLRLSQAERELSLKKQK